MTKRVAPAHGPNPGFLFPVARLLALPPRRPIAEAFVALRGEIVLADDFDELPA